MLYSKSCLSHHRSISLNVVCDYFYAYFSKEKEDICDKNCFPASLRQCFCNIIKTIIILIELLNILNILKMSIIIVLNILLF